jgi:2-hydroxy-3-oxopropionate reductase
MIGPGRHPAHGLSVADELDEVGSACSVVLTMLPDLPEVDVVLDRGFFAAGTIVQTLVVMGTVSPVAVRELAATQPRLRVVDVPVSGGRAAGGRHAVDHGRRAAGRRAGAGPTFRGDG